ncbi:hypothetical protein CLOM_g18609 [Closterium sp. NIES-68]|nr:hypothetical protein CLOM_g18609 [Closterium sp. NIES-68]GJP86097.1 hypothetical protein CLOP_g16157 [Closterium sp. NIES-67]
MADENQQVHAVARKAPAPIPAAPGAPAPSMLAAAAGARSFSSRRVLAEVGNLVELAAAAAAAGKDGKLPTAAAAASAAATNAAGAGKPLPGSPAQLDKGAKEACASAATSAIAATVDVPVLLAAPAASASAATEQTAAAAGAEGARGPGGAAAGRAGARNQSGGRKAGEREQRGQREKEEERARMMTMTASLTACSEEACGGGVGGGIGGDGGVELMDAEVPAVMDIDWEDRGNPLAATAYVRDIYALYRRMERESMAAESYMNQQADINDKMRAILLDWLIEVHLKFKLMPETLFLTANLIDRYLSLAPVRRRNLQLVGVTAMLIASKYEEIWAPEVRDFVYISDNAYSKEEVISLEKDMLNALRFHLTVPTPYVFASRFLKAAAAATAAAAAAGGAAMGAGGERGGEKGGERGGEKATQSLAWFLLELCLPEYSMLRFPPSHLAAAAVYTTMLARSQHLMSQQGLLSGGSAAGGAATGSAVPVAGTSSGFGPESGASTSSCDKRQCSTVLPVSIPVAVLDSQSLATTAAASVASVSLSTSISSSSSGGSSGGSSSGSSSGRSRPFWCPVMVRHTGYTEAELQPCVRMMAALQHKAGTGNLTAVYKKYSSPKFGEVAKLPHVSLPAATPVLGQ